MAIYNHYYAEFLIPALI